MANRKLSWSNSREIRRSLAAVNNMLLNGSIEPDKARAITYNCNTILAAIKQFETEKEIEELKEIVKELEARENEK